MPKLVNEHQLAAELDVSVSCVRNWKATGAIGSYRIGGTTRYNLDSILGGAYVPPTK